MKKMIALTLITASLNAAAIAPLSQTSNLDLIALEEDIASVELDSNNYLESGVMTLELESVVEEARAESQELAALSDRDIIKIFIDVLKVP